MVFGKTKLELKVGIFVFIGLTILVFFVLSIGGFKTWRSGYWIKVNFSFVNGVKVGAPVRFAGVDIGAVKKISLESLPKEKKTEVCLDIWLRKNVLVPVDSGVWINTLGLLGEKYVEIIPGHDYANCLKDQQVLAGIDPLPMHVIFNTAEDIMEGIDKITKQINSSQGTLGKLIYNDALYNEFEAFATDVRKNPWKLLWKAKEKK